MQHQHHNKKYTCPMHPEIVQDEPGNCPICGMNLVPAKAEPEKTGSHHQQGSNASMGMEGHNHPAHSGMIADFKKWFYVLLVLTIPIMLLSNMIQQWLVLIGSLQAHSMYYSHYQPLYFFMVAFPF